MLTFAESEKLTLLIKEHNYLKSLKCYEHSFSFLAGTRCIYCGIGHGLVFL